MRSMPRILLLALATLAGCGSDASGPGMAEGDYVLRSLNDAPLPYDHEGLGCCTYQSGTLSLEGAVYELAITARNRNSDEVFTAIEYGKVSGPASSIAFAADSFSVSPLGAASGSAANDSLRVAFGGEGPGSPDQFHGIFIREP